LADFVVCAWGLILWITFAIAADLTIAARFQFFYFPAVLAIAAVLLARVWQEAGRDKPWWQAGGKRAVLVVLALNFLGGVTVVSDLGYQKFERPDLMAQAARQFAPPGTQLLLATTHHSHGQIAEMMGVGWQFHQQNHEPAPHFLLAHKEDGSELAAQVLARRSKPFPVPFS
ncbi:MAG: glycosyltransferase, partial [Chloroflexaceae bacterium]|nr:glycosyltransferase [Chloroflexaceae bacterium]